MNEYLLDSNILLRHFLQDIPSQSHKATTIIKEIENGKRVGHLSILVVNEVIWILKKFYKAERNHSISQFLKILHIDNIKVIEIKKEILFRILEKMKSKNIDFTDIYLYEIRGSRIIISFDRDFEKLKN